MDLLQSITLGLIQGTTEWLPISSTGHLRIAEQFFALNIPLLFDVILHVATLLVTLIYFRSSVKNTLLALWHRELHSQEGRLILPLITGSISTGVFALLIGNELNAYFNTLILLGAGFFISGLMLAATKFTSEQKTTISTFEALLIGIMQGLSIAPSISRSGFTIGIAMLLGIKKELAFKFSFLLSIPAIIGALFFTLYQENSLFLFIDISPVNIFVAFMVTIATSFLALKVLWKTLAANKFHLFAFYCFSIGTLLVALELLCS
jgi:undecaprenyl-diphosphatase